MSLHESPRAKPKIPLPRALPKRTRKLVEQAMERHQAAFDALLAFLNEADGDPDLEPSLADTHGDDREGDYADPPPGIGIDENELDASYNETHGKGGQIGSGFEDDEPELGWPAMTDQVRAASSCKTYITDRGNLGGYACITDGEPSLGSVEAMDQTGWSRGNSLDYEEEHDGKEPNGDEEDTAWLETHGGYPGMPHHEDAEPSLGSVEGASGIDQRLWSAGSRDDLEQQCEDEGAVEGL